MPDFDPQAYGPEFSVLLVTNRCRPLDEGRPVDELRGPLKSLELERAFDHEYLVDRAMGLGCMAGLWLLYDYLDQSHHLSQQIENASGSFWHAIMHRREGDFSNSKYWFRRVGDHPIFEQIASRTAEIAEGDPQSDEVDRLVSGEWDPYAFVDLCERALGGLSNVQQECELIQQAEWELLFDYCYRAAIGKL